MADRRNMIYLDNNSTTLMPIEVQREMLNWCNKGNPSSSYSSAVLARKMMNDFRNYIGELCSFNACCPEERDKKNIRRDNTQDYKVIFTSGASEANSMLINGVLQSYKHITNKVPHIIISAIEHKSIIDMINSYVSKQFITASIIQPTISGHIHPDEIKKQINQNTCLICIMHANNETGAINDIGAIGSLAHSANIPFHCDTAQTFGKINIDPINNNIDSFCISFHKLHGPPGIGALVIKQELILGYKFSPMIFGSQNEGLRGGTENLPGIGASFAALKYIKNRPSKQILSVKRFIMDQITAKIPTRQYTKYVSNPVGPRLEIIFLSGPSEYYLDNTILLSVVKRSRPYICNSKIKDELEKKGIIVSIGSACNTSSSHASHVLYAMNADEYIRKGALRVSIGDETTAKQAQIFVNEFLCIVNKY